MIVKVCGMRDPDNIRAVEALNPDMMGFIFYPKSKRYVASKPAYMPQACHRVGVFVNDSLDRMLAIAREYCLDWVQLHGDESPQVCQALADAGLKVIKAFAMASATDVERTTPYEGMCHMFVFDTACAGYGGSGECFDWSMLSHYHGSTPFLLSGGIGPDSERQLSAFSHPQWAGVDINSRFEIAPALKDTDKLNTFMHQI